MLIQRTSNHISALITLPKLYIIDITWNLLKQKLQNYKIEFSII